MPMPIHAQNSCLILVQSGIFHGSESYVLATASRTVQIT